MIIDQASEKLIETDHWHTKSQNAIVKIRYSKTQFHFTNLSVRNWYSRAIVDLHVDLDFVLNSDLIFQRSDTILIIST